MMKEFDKYSMIFGEKEDFLGFLKEREDNTIRVEIPGVNVKFTTLEKSRKYYKNDAELAARLGVSEDVIQDTRNNTDMIAVLNDGNSKPQTYLLGDSAWISIKNRMKIYGEGFDLLGSDIQSTNMNKRFSQIEKNVKVIIAHNKIRAIMSDEYAVVSTAELFKTVLETTQSRFGAIEVVSSYVDHNIARCKVLLPDLKEELNKLYDLPDGYTPGIIIETSDTGFSANKIGPYWQSDKGISFVNENEYIYMMHKGNASLEKILDELPNLFLKYQNTLKKFAKLMTIKVDNPVSTLKKACSHIKIPKKYTKQVSEEFELFYQNKVVTAYDICKEIMRISSMVENSQKTTIEEKVGKAININYLALMSDED